ncbi:MAG: MlaD family protein [Deltaproteobacteria bacterium]|nr:MlaD family protein [Deltaproteobacteria bacterium]
MASQRTKFAVGLFVVSGIVISLMAIVWLGMSRYLGKGHYFTAYFNESVQGLNQDAPVKYRGVPIGRVEKIRVAPDSNLIEVIMKIETGQTLDRSYVAQLKNVGITGSMFVELDRKKPGEPDRSPHISFPSEYPIVASRPSELSQLLGDLNSVFTHIKTLDLKGISEKMKLTLDNMNGMMAEVDVKGISEKLNSTLDGADRLMDEERWDRILAAIDQAAQSINQLMPQAAQTMDQANKTLGSAERLLAENEKEIQQTLAGLVRAVENANILLEKGTSFISRTDDAAVRLIDRLSVSAQNLERATDSLNQFLEVLADHPSQLVFGEPPAARIMDREGKHSQN